MDEPNSPPKEELTHKESREDFISINHNETRGSCEKKVPIMNLDLQNVFDKQETEGMSAEEF